MIDAEMVASKPDPSYVMACEMLHTRAHTHTCTLHNPPIEALSTTNMQTKLRVDRQGQCLVCVCVCVCVTVAEVPVPSPQSDPAQVTCVGLAAVDVASGHVLVGEFCDDEVCDTQTHAHRHTHTHTHMVSLP